MKFLLKTILFFGFLIVSNISCINAKSNFHITNNSKLTTIDNKDSVYFNLTAATISGDILDIPLYIESDDDINSLDFSLLYNTEKLTYQKIIDHTGHIQYTDFFNPTDQTLRFTSNSFTTYNSNVKIVSVRFKLVNQCISEVDFFKSEFLLNGDSCSPKISKATICRTSANEDISKTSQYNVYPIPTSNNEIYIDGDINGSIEIYNLEGKVVYDMFPFEIKEKIALNGLKPGLYILKIYTDQTSFSKRIIILSN